MPPTVLVLCGPTATGKSKLGVLLAKTLGGEIVSVDSMQVYKKMRIGTARPTEAEMDGIPHHMLAIAEPWENYSVARYVEDASRAVDDILSRGKLPILVGGTGQYIDALCNGTPFSAFLPESGQRDLLRARAQAEGLPALYEELKKIDPEAAARIHPNDEKRTLRALEVFYETGLTISAHNRQTKLLPPRYKRLTIVLNYKDRADLYDRINQRVDRMMAEGLAQEVRSLLQLPPDCTAMQAIGYKELRAAVTTGSNLDEAVEEIKLRSRQYAKRQLSWFRRDQTAHWLFLEKKPDFTTAVQDSTEYLRQHGLR